MRGDAHVRLAAAQATLEERSGVSLSLAPGKLRAVSARELAIRPP